MSWQWLIFAIFSSPSNYSVSVFSNGRTSHQNSDRNNFYAVLLFRGVEKYLHIRFGVEHITIASCVFLHLLLMFRCPDEIHLRTVLCFNCFDVGLLRVEPVHEFSSFFSSAPQFVHNSRPVLLSSAGGFYRAPYRPFYKPTQNLANEEWVPTVNLQRRCKEKQLSRIDGVLVGRISWKHGTRLLQR